MLGIVASRNGISRNGRVRNGRSRIGRSRIGTSTTVDSRTGRHNLDILNTASIPSACRSIWLNTLMMNCNLVDPYRHFFPDTPEFMYVPFAVDATNRSRLDFF